MTPPIDPALQPLRVLVIADDPLIRASLVRLLEESDICITVGEQDSGIDLSAWQDSHQPDILLWDVGWDATEMDIAQLSAVLAGGAPLVMLLPTHEGDGDLVGAAWAAGARAILPRSATLTQLELALQAVVNDLAVIYREMTDALYDGTSLRHGEVVEELTPRELEVLRLLAEGLPNKGIAQRLGISEHTVKFHVNAILGKLAAQSRTEAVVKATRLGFIYL